MTCSPTPSLTASASLTPTPSITLPVSTASPSARPFRLLLQPQISAPVPLELSDSIAPATVVVSLDPCTTETALRVRCVAAAAQANSTVLMGVNQLPLSSDVVVVTCASTASKLLPVKVLVGASWGSASGSSSLVCEAFQAQTGNSIAAGTLDLVAFATLWPEFSQAIVVSHEGVMRSALDGGTLNVSSALLAEGCFEDVNCTITTVARSPYIALGVAQDTWGDVYYASAAATGAADAASNALLFTMTVTGSTVIVLFGNHPAFSVGVNVTIGGAPCSEITVSPDRQWVSFLSPSADTLCPGQAAQQVDCGYQALVISNSHGDGQFVYSGTLACPPYCPGVIGELHARKPRISHVHCESLDVQDRRLCPLQSAEVKMGRTLCLFLLRLHRGAPLPLQRASLLRRHWASTTPLRAQRVACIRTPLPVHALTHRIL